MVVFGGFVCPISEIDAMRELISEVGVLSM